VTRYDKFDRNRVLAVVAGIVRTIFFGGSMNSKFGFRFEDTLTSLRKSEN